MLSIATLSLAIAICGTAWLFSRFNAPDPAFPQPDEIAPKSSATPACFPGTAVSLDQRVADPLFFPTNLPISDFQDLNKRIFEWYSKKLVEMKEPSLYALADSQVERYRLLVLVLPSSRHPVTVRVESVGERRTIAVKELDRYDQTPAKLIVDQIRPLSEHEWNRFRYLLDQACFWQMPVHQHLAGGEDGVAWILEGEFGGKYKVVDLMALDDGSFKDACDYLLRISGLKLASKEVY
jgi:hypothetical protein